MKVADILKIPALKGCTVIGGHLGLEREVLHVNMMDAPDIISFLKPCELLVTTAYHLKDNTESILELIRAMDKQGCAALGIKTKRFIKEIPEEVTALADELAFPLIELSIDTSLGEIVNHTLSHILDKRTLELQNAMDTHRIFTSHIMSGKGIHQLLKSLSSMVGFPVILIDQYAKPIYTSKTNEKYMEPLEDLYKNDFHFFFPNTPYFQFSLINNKETYSVFSVYTHERKAGYVVIVGEINANDHVSILTIEQAANVLSFELMKEDALKQYFRRVRNEFFFNFVDGQLTSQEEIVSRAKEFSLQSEQKYLCAAGALDSTELIGSYTQNQQINESIYEYIEDELTSAGQTPHLFTRGDLCYLLIELEESSQINDRVIPALELIQKKIKAQFNRTISFGLSNLATNLLHVKNAYKEAGDSLQTGQMSGKSAFIQLYRTKDIMELLRIVPKKNLQDFYHNALNLLSAEDYEEDQTLLQTLFVFLETHCQISETAKRLYVHRNTVVYRLEKCEELLGRSLNDPETTLQIRLAFQIKTLLEA